MRWFVASSPTPTSWEQILTLKWSRNLKRRIHQGRTEKFDAQMIELITYRPFVRHVFCTIRRSLLMNMGETSAFFPHGSTRNPVIWCHLQVQRQPFAVLASNVVPNLIWILGRNGAAGLPRRRSGHRIDNITDWALTQFTTHDAAETGNARPLGRSPKRPSFTTSTPCCTTRPTAKSTRRTSNASSRASPSMPIFGGGPTWGEQLMAPTHRL